jgi:hypothetical protein
MKPAPHFAVALAPEPMEGLLEADVLVKLTSSEEIGNPVFVDAKVTPVPLTHKLLVPAAPTVKFTPAHYPSVQIVR